MSFGLLIELLLTFSALFQIEQLLLRNQSPHKVVTEQAYRLQQGLLLTSTQQQVRVELFLCTFVSLQSRNRHLLPYQNPDLTFSFGFPFKTFHIKGHFLVSLTLSCQQTTKT